MKYFVSTFITLLLLPVLFIGFVCHFIPILATRKKVSTSTYEPLYCRLVLNLIGDRPDPTVVSLAKNLPAINNFAYFLYIKPVVWHIKIAGVHSLFPKYPPEPPISISEFLVARCDFFDRSLTKFLIDGGKQIVILGAGWESRSYYLLKEAKHIFEVDQYNTQRIKLTAIKNAGIDASKVTYVSCDFNSENWMEKLQKSGLDANKKTFILWEGVSMYLREDAINRTIENMSKLAPSSQLAFDFFTQDWLLSFAGKTANYRVKLMYGESFKFGVPLENGFSQSLNQFLKKFNMRAVDKLELGVKKTYGGIVTAELT